MRILYITPFVPWPVRIRSWNLIPRLSRRNEIFLLCLTASADEEKRAEHLRSFCQEVQCVRHRKVRALTQCALTVLTPVPLRMAYFRSPAMKAAVKRALADFAPDVIYLERWRLLPCIPRDSGVPILCDPTDSMLLYNTRLIRGGAWWEKLIGLEEGAKFLACEPKLARRANLIVYCSDVDLECVRRRAPDARFAIISNGVDCRKFFFKKPEEEQNGRIVFTGNFKYRPNRHAANYFIHRVYPRVRQHVPGSRFVLVGNKASEFVSGLGRSVPDLEVHDYVPELRPYVAAASVAVAPITVGAGITNKLTESFAAGTAVVASSMARGSLSVRDGEHLLIADTPEAFADCVVRLLNDSSLRRRLAVNARRMVEANCDWELLAVRMEDLLQDLVQATHLAPRGVAQAVAAR